jgi:hypothetical protein
MNLNQSCDVDVFEIKSCSHVVQALYLLSLTLFTFKCISDRDDVCVDLIYFISDFFEGKC